MEKKLDIGNTGAMEVKATKTAAVKKPTKKTGGDLRTGK